MRRRSAVVLVSLLVALAGCRDVSSPAPETSWDAPTRTGSWTAMAPSPLSGRGDALTTVRDGEFVVAGGWTYPDVTPEPCPPGADCAGPSPEFPGDAASWSPATGAWTPRPALAGLDGYSEFRSLERYVGSSGLDRAAAPTGAPMRPLEDGRWVGTTFVVAGSLDRTAEEQNRRTIAVGTYDALTGAWTVTPWPLPDPYQEDLVTAWTGTELVLISQAVGPGCSDGQFCRQVVTWAPGGVWRHVAEWPVGPVPGSSTPVDTRPGHADGFATLLWDGHRVLGVTTGDGVRVDEVSLVDGTVTPVGDLDGAFWSSRPWFLVHDGELVVVDDRQVAVMDSTGSWSRLPQVPGARQDGRVAAVLGDELVVWGGRAFTSDPASQDSSAGWTFPLD